MKILVTGGGGFIGSHTVDLLASRGHDVLVVDNFSNGKMENLESFKGRVEICDITYYQDLEQIFKKFWPEAIIHLAAQSAITTAWGDPIKDMKVNTGGTLNLLKLAAKFSVEKFVFSSTAAVYGPPSLEWLSRFGSGFLNDPDARTMTEDCRTDPDTPYGISKLAAENYIRLLFPNHVILRYANIYGPRQTPIGENQVVARALDHFINGADFYVVGDGEQKRDFVFVGDVAVANYLAVTGDQTGTFNVASGKSLSVNEILKLLEKNFGVEGYKWIHTVKQDERGSVYMSGDKIRKSFDWKANMYIQDGLNMTAAWWRMKK